MSNVWACLLYTSGMMTERPDIAFKKVLWTDGRKTLFYKVRKDLSNPHRFVNINLPWAGFYEWLSKLWGIWNEGERLIFFWERGGWWCFGKLSCCWWCWPFTVRVFLPGIWLRWIGPCWRFPRFDEPEAGIDLWSFAKLVETFQHLQAQSKQSIILISVSYTHLKL